MATLLGCSTEEETTPEPDTYTIMVYGVGGGEPDGKKGLDMSLIMNLEEIITTGGTGRVAVTAQFKWSPGFDLDPDTDGTQPWAGTKRLMAKKQPVADFSSVGAETSWEVFEDAGDNNVNFANPDTLKAFIRWSQAKSNTSKYILVLWDHGGGWTPEYDIPFSVRNPSSNASRAVVFDGYNDYNGLSAYDTGKAIRDSGVPVEMVYYDACYMGTLEVLGELKNAGVNYSLSAGHTTTGIGGNYGYLIKSLQKDKDFETAIADYCYFLLQNWQALDPSPQDITFANLNKLDDLFTVVAKIATYLKAGFGTDDDGYTLSVYSYGNKKQKAQHGVYFFDNADPCGTDDYPLFVDILSYTPHIADKLNDGKLLTLATELFEVMLDAVVYGEQSVETPVNCTFSVNLPTKAAYTSEGYAAAKYEELYFDRKTGWSSWLQMHNLTLTLPDEVTQP
jgi:hypothetical protein